MNENEIIERVEHILDLSDGDEGFICSSTTADSALIRNDSLDEQIHVTLSKHELKSVTYLKGRMLYKVYQAPHVADLEYEDETDSNNGYTCLVDEDLVYEFLENNYL